MVTTLKSFFSPSLVRHLAADIVRVHPAFPEKLFVKRASTGLDALELLERGKHIAGALAACLPPAYPDAIAVLLRSLGPELPRDELVGAGMAPFFYLPHVIFVAERGLGDFDLSMQAQYELTKRFSAEFSIRCYLAKNPERACGFLRRWASDENAHVRRLVSEGTRLRLPWAARVPWLDANPERTSRTCASIRPGSRSVVAWP
jgi:3-methyladenine DNA glycosylase AlkC